MDYKAFREVLEKVGALVEAFQSLALKLGLGRDEIIAFKELVRRMLAYAVEQLEIRGVKG